MISGVHSAMVIVPRSGISTVRPSVSGGVAGTQLARLRRVLPSCRRAISVVGGG